jgi:uncharacterized protein YqhQ
VRKYNYGGQAVIEGVMMRGRRSAAVALRAPAGGILVHEEQLPQRLYASHVAHWPFVRGVVLLWDMLVLGTRMMLFAANVSLQPPVAEASDEHPLAARPAPSPSASATHTTASAQVASGQVAAPGTIVEASPLAAGAIGGGGLAITLLLSIGFAVGLFFLLPLAAVGAAHRWIGDGWLNLILEGVLRLAILIGYLALIGRMPGIQRVFAYHGAEHKAINTLEGGQPLDVEHVRRASRVHTRCGTGFLLIVVVLSIFVFALVGNPPVVLRVLSRVLLVPVIAAIAYELMRLGATYYRRRLVRWLMAPSLALQGLTTREPDDGQIECAIVALERVLRTDGVAALERVA